MKSKYRGPPKLTPKTAEATDYSVRTVRTIITEKSEISGAAFASPPKRCKVKEEYNKPKAAVKTSRRRDETSPRHRRPFRELSQLLYHNPEKRWSVFQAARSWGGVFPLLGILRSRGPISLLEDTTGGIALFVQDTSPVLNSSPSSLFQFVADSGLKLVSQSLSVSVELLLFLGLVCVCH